MPPADPSLNALAFMPTEQINPRTRNIDLLATRHILQKLNEEDQEVPRAIALTIAEITTVVDAVVAGFQKDKKLYYIGAGTSGRLGVLDASECPPTFGVPEDQVIGIMAGGDHALRHAVEGVEDNAGQGEQDLAQYPIGPGDVVIGLSASGRAPYVLGALSYAHRQGATTACITCARTSALAEAASLPIVVEVGPEPIAGSTRMKAGTAQKLVLNMISTAAMIQVGKTYQNLMVDVQPTNEKLKNRAQRIVMSLGEVSQYRAQEVLEQTGYQVKPSIVMLKLGYSYPEACRRLEQANGKLRVVLGDEDGTPETELETEFQTRFD